jgi:hypothetical protein
MLREAASQAPSTKWPLLQGFYVRRRRHMRSCFGVTVFCLLLFFSRAAAGTTTEGAALTLGVGGGSPVLASSSIEIA